MRVGIIGASFAKAAYLPALRHIHDAEVVALASARIGSAQAAAAQFRRPPTSTTIGSGCSPSTPSTWSASPRQPVTHAPMTLAALEAGAHVFAEKPTAMNAGEAAQMLERAEALGRVHMIDHELRFKRPAAAHAAARAIGCDRRNSPCRGPEQSEAVGVTRARVPEGDWWSSAEMGGGRLGANGSHQVDLLRWIFGEITAVCGQAKTLVPKRVNRENR